MKVGGSAPRISVKSTVTAALFAAVIALVSPFVARDQQSAAPKRILVLYWGNKDYPGNVQFDQYFQEVLKSSPEWTEYYPEYLDTDRFPGEAQSQFMHDWLRQKYADRPMDVVVALSDAPLDFLFKYRGDLFSTVPIVIIANKPPTAEQVAAGPGLTGFINHNSYRETLDLALAQHPGAEQVLVVSGSLMHDKVFENAFRQDFQDYEGRVPINYLTDLAPNELTAKMKGLPTRSIVLYVWQCARNEQGKLLETQEFLALVAKSASVPIYGVASWQVGRGIVGGYVRAMETNGARAAKIALQIANGARAQDIPVENITTVPMFDGRELKRWGIREESLPPGAIVRFRAPSFWTLYKWYAIALISVVIVQSVLIAGLIANRGWRKRAEEERERAQLEVAESQSRLAGVVGSAMDAIVSIDEEQRIVLFNAAAEKMFGCAEREVIGQTLERFIPGPLREANEEHLRAFGETNITNRALGALRISGRRSDGEVFPIEASISQLELHGQKFYTVILRDISKRNQAIEALRESEERFRNMADTAPVMIWVADADKLRTYFNQQWLDFTGRSTQDELGNGWVAGVHSDDLERCLNIYKTAFELREPFRMEYRLRRSDGQFCWVYDSGIARFSARGEFLGYIGSCIDITERKAAEEALADLGGQLIRARENECARIARELHDNLNQKMALISIHLEILGQNPPETPEKLRKNVQVIVNQASEISQEIHRMSHDLHPSKLVHLGLAAAVKSLCDDLRDSHGLKTEFIHEDVPADLSNDISLCLYRIVQECLHNVIKHSGQQEAEVELRGTEKGIWLRVSDSGIGFDSESPGIWKGLGLISMKERLRLVGGQISVASRPSQGTQVDIRVPLEPIGAQYEGPSPPDKTRAAGR